MARAPNESAMTDLDWPLPSPIARKRYNLIVALLARIEIVDVFAAYPDAVDGIAALRD